MLDWRRAGRLSAFRHHPTLATPTPATDLHGQDDQAHLRPWRPATLLENLESFTEDKSNKDEAAGEAMDSTEERNKAYVALRAYMKELKGIARGALRDKPGLLAKLEL